MIVDQLKCADRYLGLHKNITAALEFIREHAEDAALEDGVYEVIPDEVVIHVVTKDTHARTEAQMEIHKKFMDIHYIIQGAERCGMAPLPDESVIEYNPETDNGFWSCEDSFDVRVGEGEFYVVWPMEPHCPLCHAGADRSVVRKMICKVKVDS